MGDAGDPTGELSLGEDSFLPWPLSSLVGLLASALVVSVAILPPSFSQRSSIFFFRRFLAIGSGIVVSLLTLHFLIFDPQRGNGLTLFYRHFQLLRNGNVEDRCDRIALGPPTVLLRIGVFPRACKLPDAPRQP